MSRGKLHRKLARQQGFALIAILTLVALISAFLIASALNRSSAEVSNERDDRNMRVLREAKAALINYAASEQWQLYRGLSFQPGALPYPDQDDDGDSDLTGVGINAQTSIIGRLPWKTMGIDDLRDTSGERLWYALSHDFRKLQCSGGTVPPNCTIINSDTKGQLTVVGTSPATQVVAVLFAPGEPLQGQIRDPANVAAHNNPVNYLEGPPNLDLPARLNFVFTTAQPSSTFNDRVLIITQAELMAAVEPVVAAMIERDIVTNIQDYFGGSPTNPTNGLLGWQAYPFPAQFNPGLAASSWPYIGDTTLTEGRGLLPMTGDSSVIHWDVPPPGAVTEIAGGGGAGTGSPSGPLPYILDGGPDCSNSTPIQIICKIDYTGVSSSDRPNIQLQVKLLKAGLGFPKPFGIADVKMYGSDTNLLSWNGTVYGYFSNTPPDPPFPNVPPLLTQTIDPSSGDGTVTIKGILQGNAPPPAGTGGHVTITIWMNYEPFISTTPPDPKTGWFVANAWYRQTYYAVSKSFLPGAANTCNTPFPCLTVNNLRPSYTTSNDKRAILVLAGRSLNGGPRPSMTLADYFENANLTAANGTVPFVYENRAGTPTSINDRVVVIAP